MARTINGVTQVRTPYRATQRTNGKHGLVKVTFNLEMRVEYLLKERVQAVIDECGDEPSPVDVLKWERQIREVLLAKLEKENGNV